MGANGEVFALIVEDHLAIARLVQSVLRVSFHLEARIASSAAAARSLIDAGVRPRVFMLDLELRGGDRDGMSLAEELRVRFPHTHIAFMTAHHDRDLSHRALRLRAQYVLKPYAAAQIALVVEQALVVPELENRLLGAMDSLRIDYHLSPRERQLLELKLEHYTHDQVAELLELRRCTVDKTSRSLLDKTRADSVQALAHEAWQIARSEERPQTRRGETEGGETEGDERRRDATRRDATRREQVARHEAGVAEGC